MKDETGDFPDETPEQAATRGKLALPPFRFTIMRLAIATAATPWPFLAMTERSETGKVALFVCALAVAGVVVIIRAVDLPRVNLTATLFLLFMAVMEFITPFENSVFGTCIKAVLAAIPAFLFTAGIFPRLDDKGRSAPALPAISVLRTAIFPYLMMLLAQWAISAPLLKNDPSPGVEPELVRLLRFVALLLLAFNVYQLVFAGTKQSLEERPDLGYRYELSMILIPLAMATYLARAI